MSEPYRPTNVADMYPYALLLLVRDDTPSGWRWAEAWSGEASGHDDAYERALAGDGELAPPVRELTRSGQRFLTVCHGEETTVRERTVRVTLEDLA